MSNHLVIHASVGITSATESEWAEEIPLAQRRRTPRIWRMALAASNRLFKSTDKRAQSVIVASALGALDETRDFLDGVFLQNAGAPRNFIASVHNSMAGRLALEYGISGPNLTLCDGQNSFASAVASAMLLNHNELPALVVIVDEQIPLLTTLSTRLTPGCGEIPTPVSTDGAVAMLLGTPCTDSHRFISAAGPVPVADGRYKGTWESLADASSWGPGTAPAYDADVLSFIQPALCAADLFAANTPGHFILGSYSPSARAAAIIDIYL